MPGMMLGTVEGATEAQDPSLDHSELGVRVARFGSQL